MAVDNDLVSISEFARQYRVDESVVRKWIKAGYVNYALVNGFQIRKIRKSEVVKVIPADIKYLQERGTNEREGTTDKVPHRGSEAEAGRDQVSAGRIEANPQVQGRNGSTTGGTRPPEGRGGRSRNHNHRR